MYRKKFSYQYQKNSIFKLENLPSNYLFLLLANIFSSIISEIKRILDCYYMCSDLMLLAQTFSLNRITISIIKKDIIFGLVFLFIFPFFIIQGFNIIIFILRVLLTFYNSFKKFNSFGYTIFLPPPSFRSSFAESCEFKTS